MRALAEDLEILKPFVDALRRDPIPNEFMSHREGAQERYLLSTPVYRAYLKARAEFDRACEAYSAVETVPTQQGTP
jgi:hypothetical protein